MTSLLFQPIELRGGIRLANRVVMAPMTRARAIEGDVPNPLSAMYYGQRATAGLIVTEGVNISAEAKGYSQTPGIFTDAQQTGWCFVADEVHKVDGSRIFLQLWHVGRLSHADVSGLQPAGPSAVRPPRAKVWIRRPDGWEGLIDVGEPREMTHGDIRRTVSDYAAAARRAADAGMDGVEIHGANGYLVDQFLRATTNHRDDEYGGSVENRLRFLKEVVAAVAAEVGGARTGVRLSPFVEYGDTTDPQIEATLAAAAGWLDGTGVAYLHFAQLENQHLHRARGDRTVMMNADLKAEVRQRFSGPLIMAGEYTAESAEPALRNREADLVAFGRPYIANPDLVDRLRTGAELNPPDQSTWYGGGARGFTDYPSLRGLSQAGR